MTIGSVSVVWGGSGPTMDALFPFAEQPYETLFRMDETGVALYGAANANNRQFAYAEVQRLRKGLKSEMVRSYGDEAGWEKLSLDLATIETALAKGAPNSEWREPSARVRLALDAVVGGSGSLWYQYKRLLQDDVQLIGQALKRSTEDRGAAAEAALALLGSMSAHVNRIEPAAAISGQGLRMEELKQRMAYSAKMIELTDKGEASATVAAVRTALQSLEDASGAIDNIFRMDAADANAMPAIAPTASVYPLQWSFFLGSLISAVLTFVGWRKYKQTPYGVKSIK
ncbi:MAG: hypothetical protein K0Q63_2587 [Paenibacillus sp.]|nr:hypothetical protein [Paenibacillus sp.]